jgi:hypothetical protein
VRGHGRGRGRGRGRGGGRGRGAGRGSRTTASGRSEAVSGWRVSGVEPAELILEDKFAEQVIEERARLFWPGALDHMRETRFVREPPASRSGFVVLFAEDLLMKCMQWTNEYTVLNDFPMEKLNLWDIWRYLALTLLYHTTGLSLEKTIEMVHNLGASSPSLERVKQVATHIKAFTTISRGRTGERTWNAQRYQTVQLEPFENAAFVSCKIFFQLSHSVLTLDVDLYGTRASDNQVKLLSSRKADK